MSPFNVVKLELALFAAGAPLLWFMLVRLNASSTGQLAWLSGYGLAAFAWVVLRTRSILLKAGKTDEASGN